MGPRHIIRIHDAIMVWRDLKIDISQKNSSGRFFQQLFANIL